jgi:hypothetical protein
LIAAILRRALLDLKPTADPAHQATARRFWQNERGELAWWCDVLGLDLAQVQQRIGERYPQVWAPRQLELALEETL